MPNRLVPLNLIDFTGGLNLRRNQFQLADNESPRLENVEVDPSGGIYTRDGWELWDQTDLVAGDWNPRSAYTHTHSTGAVWRYVSNQGEVLYADETPTWAVASALTVGATPHQADFAAWSDSLYIACGQGNQSGKRTSTSAPALIPLATTGSWNDTYTTPTGNTLPSCDYFEVHGARLFAAGIDESGAGFPNRVRWSHLNEPEDWATSDYIDIYAGGSKITGLLSFHDHLLIFKTDSLWALYGYDNDSWQLIQVSAVAGAPSNQAFTRSADAVFFYSDSGVKGIFGYQGDAPVEVSEALRPVFDSILVSNQVFLGWVKNRLWVSVPWTYDGADAADTASVFVYDPSFGSPGGNNAGLPNVLPAGAWVHFSAITGVPGPYFGHDCPCSHAALRGNTEAKNVIRVERITDDFYDITRYPSTLATVGGDDLVTVSGILLKALGTEKEVPPSYYQTGWVDAGWPTRKKSWRRPDFVAREFGASYRLLVEAFRDHEEAAPHRTSTVTIGSGGVGAVWGDFDWGDGTQWGPAASGNEIIRGSSFGLARTLQLKISGPTSSPAKWGLGAIILKYMPRRFR